MSDASRVLHIRNVGSEISENDIIELVQPFGMVNRIVVLRAKNQALVQMQDVASAVNAMRFFSSIQPSIRGRNVYIQFSSHQELTTSDQPGLARRADQDLQPNRILLVTIHNVVYPITVDVLHQVFSPHGFVEKIVTFQKSAGLQALVQYVSQQNAIVSKNALQNRNIYDGCCTLDIQFSNLQELQVNYNNERTWDYTNPSLPSEQVNRNANPNNFMALFGEGGGGGGGVYGLQGGGGRPVPFQHGNMGMNSYQMQLGAASSRGNSSLGVVGGGGSGGGNGALPPGITGTNSRTTLLVSNLDPEKIDADKLFNLFSNYGNIVRIKMLHNKPDHALIQMGDGVQAELAVTYLKGIMLFEKRLEVNYSKHPQINPSADTHDYTSSTLNRFNRNVAKNYKYCSSPTKMIHISSITADITEEAITEHISPHGNVVGVKIFEANGKKQALVLFENEEQATEAMVCKHASQLEGSTIRLAFSKLSSI